MTNLDFPLHFNNQGKTAGCSEDDHIRNMIEEFIFTNPGERVNRPDFGSRALQMVFEPNSAEYGLYLKNTIHAGLIQYLGDIIEIEALDVENRDQELRVLVTYRIRGRTGKPVQETFSRGCP